MFSIGRIYFDEADGNVIDDEPRVDYNEKWRDEADYWEDYGQSGESVNG